MAIAFTVKETTFTSGFGEWTYGVNATTAKRSWNLQASEAITADNVDFAVLALPVAQGNAYKPGDVRTCLKITVKALAGELDGLYAEAEYGINPLGELNPLMRKDTISLEVAGETESWFVDTEGKPTVTSAGEILDKVPPRTTGGVKLVIEGNRSTLPAADLITKMRPSNINTASMTIRGITLNARQAKLVACSGSEQTENDVTFYRVRWELALAPDWDLKLDDRGFSELSGGQLIKIRRNGDFVTKPWPLSGGVAASSGTTLPAVLTFKPYPGTTFGTFAWTSAT